MIAFRSPLYAGPTAARHLKKIKLCLRLHLSQKGVYVACFVGDSTKLEIYNSCFLGFSYYKKRGIYVVAIACGRDEALELVRRIVDENYKNSGSINLAGFLHSLN